jgi:protease-4
VLAPIAVVVAGLLLIGAAPKTGPEAPSKGAPAQPKVRVLEVTLSGSIEEMAQVFMPFGPRGRLLRDYTASIRKAATDDTIKALILRINMPELGMARLQELADAIAEFKATGKKVYCYFQIATNRDYLLACSGSRIVAPAEGMLLLTGLSAEVTFFKRMLDWLGIKADVIFIGKNKSAAEPFTNTAMSDDNRRVFNELIDDIFGQFVAAIAKGRNLAPEKVREAIDRGPYAAREAVKAQLIDETAYYDDLVESIGKELGGTVDLVKDYHRLGKQGLDLGELNIFSLFAALQPKPEIPAGTKPKIAIIYASGMIAFGGEGLGLLGQVITADAIGKAFEKVRKEPSVKAVVLRIDSPGGSALASDLIWHEVERTRKTGRVVVASMSDVAASGGYYIAMGADAIVADPLTITGSIGVIGGKLALKGLYNKIGLDTETFSRGKNAALFSLTSEFSDGERERLKALMGETYDDFVKKASDGRKIPLDKMKELATGRVWTARAAKEIGLVDQLGGLKEAYDLAVKRAGLEGQDVMPVILPREKSILELLFDVGAVGRANLNAGTPVPESLLRRVPYLGVVELLSREHLFLVMPHFVDIR